MTRRLTALTLLLSLIGPFAETVFVRSGRECRDRLCSCARHSPRPKPAGASSCHEAATGPCMDGVCHHDGQTGPPGVAPCVLTEAAPVAAETAEVAAPAVASAPAPSLSS